MKKFTKILLKKIQSSGSNLPLDIKKIISLLNDNNQNDILLNSPDYSHDLTKLYLSNTDVDHLKENGQFFTPPIIAEIMSLLCLNKKPKKVLDPAVGCGILLEKLYQELISDQSVDIHNYKFNIEATAIDKDPNMILATFLNFNEKKLPIPNFKVLDYLALKSPLKEDLIIANPPYYKSSKMKNRDEIIRNISSYLNYEIPSISNIYSLFIYKAFIDLNENGKMVFITPSEFLNVGYGKALKKFLKEKTALQKLILFNPSHKFFDEGLSTACITVAQKSKPNDKVELIYVKDKDGLPLLKNELSGKNKKKTKNKSLIIKNVNLNELDYKDKWIQYFESSKIKIFNSLQLVPLHKIGKVTRGIATGANKFFTLTKNDIEKYQIEPKYISRVISKTSFCQFQNFNDDDFNSLKKENKKVYLLDIRDMPSRSVEKYLNYGIEEGVHQRYLTRNRNPWYVSEQRNPPDILCSVFGRNSLKFILNESKVKNMTAFHGLYLNEFDANKAKVLTAFFISDIFSDILGKSLRRYGDGLNKIEPGDLNEINVINVNRLEKSEIISLKNLFENLCENQRIFNHEKVRETKEKINQSFLKIIG